MEKLKSLNTKNILKYISDNIIIFLVIALSLGVAIAEPNFLSVRSILSIGTFSSFKMLIALGVSGILITKGTDLSAGRVTGFCASIAIILVQDPTYAAKYIQNPPGWFQALQSNHIALIIFGVSVVILMAALIGMINGILVAYFKLEPFIATLGMQLFIYGVHSVLVLQPVSVPVEEFRYIATAKLFGISSLILYMVLAIVLFWFLYNRTRHGKYMYAIGGNSHAAEVSGINTQATLMRIYILAGICYALAGIMLASRDTSSSSAGAAGYELDAIAACAIGGVSFNGGIGKISNVMVGVVTFEVLRTALQFIGYGDSYTFIIQGVVIVLAVALDVRKNTVKK